MIFLKQYSKYILFALVIGIYACDSSSPIETVPDMSKDYFPTKKGYYQIYDIDEIIYALGDPDTFKYQLKAVQIDSFLNTEGTYTYVIHRSIRKDATEPWVYKDTWSSRIVNNQAIDGEENIDYVKLIFPVQVGIRWNGNAYNSLGIEEFEIQRAESKIINDVTYPDCITIKQKDNQDFIVYLDQRYESYAKNVGLVYDEITQLTYCTDTNKGCIGQQIIEEGVIYKQTIVEYGTE